MDTKQEGNGVAINRDGIVTIYEGDKCVSLSPEFACTLHDFLKGNLPVLLSKREYYRVENDILQKLKRKGEYDDKEILSI